MIIIRFNIKNLIFVFGFLLLLSACHSHRAKSSNTSSPHSVKHEVPSFNSDSAYANVARQVAFGPRVPGSIAHKNCGRWLIAMMKQLSDTLYLQKTTVTTFQDKNLPCVNIIASFNPKNAFRVLLLAHWDTRPWADHDTVSRDQPIDGADDGASGVAVCLELARLLHTTKVSEGVDILLTDVEDYGSDTGVNSENSWGLGTQYWAKNPHVANYSANWGILLDMVGGSGSQFRMEGVTKHYASHVANMIWDAGNDLGFSYYFPYDDPNQASIIDDHYFIDKLTNIPTADIIALRPDGSFPPYHHTHRDNMKIISKETLMAVGQTLTSMLYTYQSN